MRGVFVGVLDELAEAGEDSARIASYVTGLGGRSRHHIRKVPNTFGRPGKANGATWRPELVRLR